MAEDYGTDIISVIDEEGKEHRFELIDAIETDDGRYVALLPVYDNNEEIIDSDGEIVIFEVIEENDEETLITIESDEIFDSVSAIFEERLNDLFIDSDEPDNEIQQ